MGHDSPECYVECSSGKKPSYHWCTSKESATMNVEIDGGTQTSQTLPKFAEITVINSANPPS